MENFIELIKPVAKKIWKKYKVELFLIIFSLLITVTSLLIYLKNVKPEEEVFLNDTTEQTNRQTFSDKILVDIAGAVEKPDVYKLTFGARLKDVLVLAGGLSTDADRQFFARNYNLARIINDQEKIYVPSVYDINNGLFTENQRILDYNQPQSVQSTVNINQEASEGVFVNVNTDSLEELDQLPGIGKVTAEKIIRGRPYQSIEELLTKKVVNKTVFEKIKELITIN